MFRPGRSSALNWMAASGRTRPFEPVWNVVEGKIFADSTCNIRSIRTLTKLKIGVMRIIYSSGHIPPRLDSHLANRNRTEFSRSAILSPTDELPLRWVSFVERYIISKGIIGR